jgi:hypothetical protein
MNCSENRESGDSIKSGARARQSAHHGNLAKRTFGDRTRNRRRGGYPKFIACMTALGFPWEFDTATCSLETITAHKVLQKCCEFWLGLLLRGWSIGTDLPGLFATAGQRRLRVCPCRSTRMVPCSHGGGSSGVPCRMRHPSPVARAIRSNPAATTTAPMACATRSLAGARRSRVMAEVATTIARRSMTPITSRTAVRLAQLFPQ